MSPNVPTDTEFRWLFALPEGMASKKFSEVFRKKIPQPAKIKLLIDRIDDLPQRTSLTREPAGFLFLVLCCSI